MTWEPKVRIISISVAIPICIEHVLTPFQIISRFVFSKYIDFLCILIYIMSRCIEKQWT